MIDPERGPVKDSIRVAHNAGIRVVMITGGTRDGCVLTEFHLFTFLCFYSLQFGLVDCRCFNYRLFLLSSLSLSLNPPDYVITAKAIAENIGIFPKGSPPQKAIDCAKIRVGDGWTID